MNAAYDSPRMVQIRRVFSTPNTKLALGRHGDLFSCNEEVFLLCPVISRESLIALLDGVPEAEWEEYVLWCFAQDHGKRRKLPRLRAERGGVYAE